MTTEHLLTPFDFHDMKIKNRIVMAPMTRARAGQQRVPNELMVKYYSQRADAGMIITEATTVSQQANGWNESPGIYTDEMADAWKTVVDAVHAKGSRIILQLWHCGRASHSGFHGGKPAVAPSAIKINGEYIHTPQGKQPYQTPRALQTDEIPSVIEDYRQAVMRAKSAGFDGVEIHGANGYLIDTFLQSKTNLRTDQYGGSIENRFRFLKEVFEAVATVWPKQKIGVRLSPNGVFNDMGSPDYREQFTYVAQQLNALQLGYLHVMDGLAFGFHELGEPMTLKDFRNVYHGPLMGNCGYDVAGAEAAIARGDADLIAFGRPFISNPDLVDRIRNGWPLAEPADMSAWYTPVGETGYTDFSTYADSTK